MEYLIDKKDKKKFNDIKQYLENQSEKLRGITENQFGTIMSCTIDLLEHKKSSTIDKTVSDVFCKYGFNVKESGIGWEITT